jgi:hypothetical protein
MKSIVTLALGLFLTLAVSAQRNTAYSINGAGTIIKTVSTTDSTLTYIDSVTTLGTNDAGVLEVSVIGMAYDTAYSVTGKVGIRYNKRRGTLTLGSVVNILTPVTDAALGTATFTVVAANDKIYVRVKGKAATNIRWSSVTVRKGIKYQ